MKRVSKEDWSSVVDEYCEALKTHRAGDGFTLYAFISLYRPDWVKTEDFPTTPDFRFKKLSHWFYKDETFHYHRYIVNLVNIKRMELKKEAPTKESEQWILQMDEDYLQLSESECDNVYYYTKNFINSEI